MPSRDFRPLLLLSISLLRLLVYCLQKGILNTGAALRAIWWKKFPLWMEEFPRHGGRISSPMVEEFPVLSWKKIRHRGSFSRANVERIPLQGGRISPSTWTQSTMPPAKSSVCAAHRHFCDTFCFFFITNHLSQCEWWKDLPPTRTVFHLTIVEGFPLFPSWQHVQGLSRIRRVRQRNQTGADKSIDSGVVQGLWWKEFPPFPVAGRYGGRISPRLSRSRLS